MNRKIRTFFWVLPIALLCVAVPLSYAADENIPADTKIFLSRGVCYGRCPIYTLTVFADGTVIYEGEAYVRVVGRQEKTISKDKLMQILNTFENLDFSKMAFDAANLKCDSYVTDIPSTEISITRNGKTDAITHANKCYFHGFFKPFDSLAQFIDDIIGTDEWISGSQSSQHAE